MTRSTIAGLKCALCGARVAVTLDHVPPRAIFPRPGPSDLVTVPACKECNEGSSVNDEEFKVGLSIMASIDTPATQALWKAGALRTLAHNRRMHREVLRRFVKVEMKTEAGIYLGTEKAILVPRKPIEQVLQRTIRGLYYHHFQETLGERARVYAQRFEAGNDPQPWLADTVRRMPLNIKGGGGFKYRFARAGDAPLASLWFMLFFDRVPIFGYTEPAEMGSFIQRALRAARRGRIKSQDSPTGDFKSAKNVERVQNWTRCTGEGEPYGIEARRPAGRFGTCFSGQLKSAA